MMKVAVTTLFSIAVVAITPSISTAIPAASLLAQDGHQHGKEEIHKLGRKTIAGYTVSVILIGEAHAGDTAKVDIKLIDAKTDPKAIRVWFGPEGVDVREKAALTKGEKTYAGEVKVPSGTPETGPLWVELETDSATQAVSYEIGGHEGHKHSPGAAL